MDENIYIGLLCLDFEEAKNFYITNLGFEIKYSHYQSPSKEIPRAILVHTIAKNLELEFMTPKTPQEVNRIDITGGSINLFTLPTHNIDSLKEKLENTKFFVSYIEAPYASFLTLEDPMGNKICLYERA